MPERPNAYQHVQKHGAYFRRYRYGLEIFWPRGQLTPPPEGERGDIKDMSTPARHRAGHAYRNAACTWLAMITLTYRLPPSRKQVKKDLEKLRRLFFERYGEGFDGWIMEMQVRGVPHFHIFVAAESACGQEIAQMPTVIYMRSSIDPESRKKKKVPRRIVRGGFDRWITQMWLSILDDDHPHTKAVQSGGICELFDSPTGAAAYVAKEANKREQKVLPESYAEGLGRWWYLAKRWEPPLHNDLAKQTGMIDGDKFAEKFGGPMKYVWDAAAIEEMLLPLPQLRPPGSRVYKLGARSMPVRPFKPPMGQQLLPGMYKRGSRTCGFRDMERHAEK